MEITIEKTVTKKVTLSKQKADVVFEAIGTLFEDMQENNYNEYLRLLAKVAPYVVECANGHGVKIDWFRLKDR